MAYICKISPLDVKYNLNIIFFARIHAFALQVAAGYWAGYQWNKWCSKKNMSEYKHAVDFAQRYSV